MKKAALLLLLASTATSTNIFSRFYAPAEKKVTIPVKRTKISEHFTASQKHLNEFYTKRRAEREQMMLLGDHVGLLPVPLDNQYNLAYTGPVYFGTPLQTSDPSSSFVYDTGSGVLTVTSTLCNKCKLIPGQYYNPSASSTYKAESSSSETTLSYGSATLEGFYAEDNVCLDTSEAVCVPDFEFFVIESQKGLDNADGILGLSPDESTASLSYIRALKNAGVIDSELFTFWINDESI
jgi:hypothetical protein